MLLKLCNWIFWRRQIAQNPPAFFGGLSQFLGIISFPIKKIWLAKEAKERAAVEVSLDRVVVCVIVFRGVVVDVCCFT